MDGKWEKKHQKTYFREVRIVSCEFSLQPHESRGHLSTHALNWSSTLVLKENILETHQRFTISFSKHQKKIEPRSYWSIFQYPSATIQVSSAQNHLDGEWGFPVMDFYSRNPWWLISDDQCNPTQASIHRRFSHDSNVTAPFSGQGLIWEPSWAFPWSETLRHPGIAGLSMN